MEINKEMMRKMSSQNAALTQQRIRNEPITPRRLLDINQSPTALSTKMDLEQGIKEEAFRKLIKRNFTAQEIQKAALHFFNCTEPEIACKEAYPFYSYNGSCNNVLHATWGMSNSKFLRLLPPDYADGVSDFRKAVSGNDLPSPRVLSLNVHSHINRPNRELTHTVMSFGQFLDHDMTRAPFATKEDGPLRCCGADVNNTQCAIIPIPKNDQFYSQFNNSCLNTVRSQRYESCSENIPREQVNVITAYLDLSMVYGNNETDAKGLRAFKNGDLRVFNDKKVGELLPQVPVNSACKENDQRRCFVTGDSRNNQHTALLCLHTVFLRIHNLIARMLSQLNRRWNDETTYQVSRSILTCIYQRIVYEEFLPVILGPEIMEKLKLLFTTSKYNPSLNAGMIHESSTAAFRLHSIVSTEFVSICQDGCKKSDELRDIFFQPFSVYDGGCNCTLNGFLNSPPQKYDRHIISDLRNHLFQTRGNASGLDLAAINIMRGRDHGLQSYTEYVKAIFDKKIESFEDLKRSGLVKEESLLCLENIYESVHDIDLFTGGTCEKPVPGGIVGPTFAVIIGIQFNTLKFGDRFFCTHSSHPSLTEAQKNAIGNLKFTNILCCSGFLEFAQEFGMLPPSKENPVKKCHCPLNLQNWKEGKNQFRFEQTDDADFVTMKEN